MYLFKGYLSCPYIFLRSGNFYIRAFLQLILTGLFWRHLTWAKYFQTYEIYDNKTWLSIFKKKRRDAFACIFLYFWKEKISKTFLHSWKWLYITLIWYLTINLLQICVCPKTICWHILVSENLTEFDRNSWSHIYFVEVLRSRKLVECFNLPLGWLVRSKILQVPSGFLSRPIPNG